MAEFEGAKRLKLSNGEPKAVEGRGAKGNVRFPRTTAVVYDRKFVEICNYYPVVRQRAKMVFSLLESYGLLKEFDLQVPCSPATKEDLRMFHAEDFVNALETGSAGDLGANFDEFGLEYDCVVFAGLWPLVLHVAGGTLTAARMLCSSRADVVVNWLGGWHHGQRFEASGFCYVNDVVLGILELRRVYDRVLYVDLDVHHGDGVQDAFESTPKVVTLSLHQFESGFFPGTGSVRDVGVGRGMYHSLNVPLKEGVGDVRFVQIFNRIAEKVVEAFRPDAVVCQCGCDGLTGDPLGGWNLTPVGLGRCVETVLSWNVPTMFLGGGGYERANAARCWTHLTAVILGKAGGDLDSDIPEHDFFEAYGPGFELEIDPGLKPDKNTDEYVEKVVGEVLGCVEEIRNARGSAA